MKFLSLSSITLLLVSTATAQLLVPEFPASIKDTWKPIAPLISSPEATIIKDQYIVVLKEDVTAAQFAAHTDKVQKMMMSKVCIR
jgi:hypothetical protein